MLAARSCVGCSGSPARGSRSSRRPAATATARTPPDPAALAEGQALFRGLCSGCHGGAGRGGKGPDLTDNRWIHGGTDADIARVIQNGVPKTTMKKLGESLKPDQIRKRDRLHPQPGPLPGREHLEAVHRRRSPGRPQALLRPQGQGPVREVPQRRRRRGPDRAGPRPHRQPPRSRVHHGVDPPALQGHRPRVRGRRRRHQGRAA